MEDPWARLGPGLRSFFILEIIMFIALVLGLGGAEINGASLQMNSTLLYLFLISVLPGLLGILLLWLAIRRTVIFISANDRHIALKFASGRVKKFEWRKMMNVRVGGKKGTFVSFDNLGRKYAFNLNSIRGIVHYYENAAHKRAHRI